MLSKSPHSKVKPLCTTSKFCSHIHNPIISYYFLTPHSFNQVFKQPLHYNACSIVDSVQYKTLLVETLTKSAGDKVVGE